MGRQLTSEMYTALKAAPRRQVKRSGGLESAASVTRVESSRLGQYQHPQHSRFVPIDVAADLVADSGSTEILQTLAGMANCVLLPLPSENADALAIDFAKFGEETAQSFADYHKALTAVSTAQPEILALLRTL